MILFTPTKVELPQFDTLSWIIFLMRPCRKCHFGYGMNSSPIGKRRDANLPGSERGPVQINF